MTNNLKLSREEAVKGIAEHIGGIIREHLDQCTKTCINCEHFSEDHEICNRWNARPPARVIAFGCEAYTDKIPF